MTSGDAGQRPQTLDPPPAGPAASAGPAERPVGMALRDPAHRVSRRAVGYWTFSALIWAVVELTVLGVVYYLVLPEKYWWATTVLVVLVVLALIDVAVKPRVRYAVHRWEVTQTAVFTRSGWLSREQRIAPLSRVQTVDSQRGALQRAFKLASITVTTASAAGPITIDCLDSDVADRVVTELTEITGRIEGDAT